MELHRLKDKFNTLFGESRADIRIFSAPGRVNLIGEHIDYNGGKVLPAAIERRTVVLCRIRKDNKLCLAADDLPNVRVEAETDHLEAFRGKNWGAYQLGVADELIKAGYKVPGCDMLFWGDVPFASGLSSSASIEVATALALAVLGERESPDMTELAKIAQRAENNFVGVNCGIMDQFVSARGKNDACILLDCSTLDFEYIPLVLGKYAIVIGNTKKPRSLADSKYNERRAECEQALCDIKKVMPEIKNLCSLTPDDFEGIKGAIRDDIQRKRARHCVWENERVRLSCLCLSEGRLEDFGALLNESHRSLKELYEVTGSELDAMAAAAQVFDGCAGSRMTGAGFGGCTVSLVSREKVDEFISCVGAKYRDATGLQPEFYVTSAARGAGEITEK